VVRPGDQPRTGGEDVWCAGGDGGAVGVVGIFALASVDLTSPTPVEKTFGVLAGMVARLEALAR